MRKNAINLKKVGVIFFLMPGLIYSQNTKEKDTLKEQKIEDVVIVGYKTQKKSSLTAAVSVISDKKLKDTNTSDVSSMLQGKAAGAQIMQSGAPGSTATVKIRGTSTINGPTDALWVVDGVMMNGTPNLDPNQIESINILKDATSTALYGSRGANGIVQVFTKSGTSSGKGILNVSMNTSFNTFTNGKFKLMDGEQFYDYFNSLQNVPATAPRGARAPGYNWLKNGTQTGVAKNYTVDFRGGSQNSKTYISGNYYDETGTIKGFDYNRLSFRINHEQTVKQWLILKPKVSLSYTTGKDVRASLFEMYLNLPWDNPRDANGNYVNPNTSVWYGRDHTNYLYDQQWNYGKNNQLDLVGNMDAEIKITDYLKFITTNNVTYRNFDSMYYIDPRSISGESNKGELSETYLKDISKFFNQMLRFDKDLVYIMLMHLPHMNILTDFIRHLQRVYLVSCRELIFSTQAHHPDINHQELNLTEHTMHFYSMPSMYMIKNILFRGLYAVSLLLHLERITEADYSTLTVQVGMFTKKNSSR